MKTLLMIAILIGVMPSAKAGELTRAQVKKEIAWQVLDLIDYRQTSYLARICSPGGYYETNPLIGKCPSQGRINTYFIVYSVGHYAVTQYLNKYRDLWQNTTLLLTFNTVAHNFYVGLKIDY